MCLGLRPSTLGLKETILGSQCSLPFQPEWRQKTSVLTHVMLTRTDCFLNTGRIFSLQPFSYTHQALLLCVPGFWPVAGGLWPLPADWGWVWPFPHSWVDLSVYLGFSQAHLHFPTHRLVCTFPLTSPILSLRRCPWGDLGPLYHFWSVH